MLVIKSSAQRAMTHRSPVPSEPPARRAGVHSFTYSLTHSFTVEYQRLCWRLAPPRRRLGTREGEGKEA